jgi:hypothetical protein
VVPAIIVLWPELRRLRRIETVELPTPHPPAAVVTASAGK